MVSKTKTGIAPFDEHFGGTYKNRVMLIYGSGKSMILELLDNEVRNKTSARFIRVDASLGGPLPLVRQILRRLGYTEMVADVSQALQVLEDLCSYDRAKFSHLALAIDEAQFLRKAETRTWEPPKQKDAATESQPPTPQGKAVFKKYSTKGTEEESPDLAGEDEVLWE